MTTGLKTKKEMVVLIGAILIIIGSTLPWGTAFGLEVSGLEGDGVYTLILGIVSIILLALVSWESGNKIGQPILGIIVIVIAGNVFLDVRDIPFVSVGLGLYLTILGGIILLLIPLIGKTLNED